jgi:ABC transporter substrate binding protein
MPTAKTFRWVFRSAGGKASLLPDAAADLVLQKVNIIVAWQTPAVTAAKQATSKIPIVMAGSGDPVGTGFVASLARPGGNVTGTASVGTELGGKCVELIREVLPIARRLAVLANMTDPLTKPPSVSRFSRSCSVQRRNSMRSLRTCTESRSMLSLSNLASCAKALSIWRQNVGFRGSVSSDRRLR